MRAVAQQLSDRQAATDDESVELPGLFPHDGGCRVGLAARILQAARVHHNRRGQGGFVPTQHVPYCMACVCVPVHVCVRVRWCVFVCVCARVPDRMRRRACVRFRCKRVSVVPLQLHGDL